MNDRSFHARSLVAFLMAGGFAVAAVTGLVLFAAPRGGLANWTGWALGGFDRQVWFDVHLVTGLLFIVAGLLHIRFNWKPLRAYLRARASRRPGRGRELAAAVALLVFAVVGAARDWPPFGYVLDLNDRARDGGTTVSAVVAGSSGVRDVRGGGMGLGRMTLAELAARHGLDYDRMAARLAAAGIVFTGNEPLRDIAARAGTTPGELGNLARGTEH